jgi:hypothetical protein
MRSVTAKPALSNLNKHLEKLLRGTVLPITLFNQADLQCRVDGNCLGIDVGTVRGVTKRRNVCHEHNCNVFWTRIALNIRAQGRGASEPGRLRSVQGIGWWLDEANISQVSLNLTDHEVTPIHLAYEEVCKDASALGVPVVGSEIVGLVPLKALLQVGGARHILRPPNIAATGLTVFPLSATDLKSERSFRPRMTCIYRLSRIVCVDRLCGLVFRAPGYTTEIYCVSCEVRTEFIYVM